MQRGPTGQYTTSSTAGESVRAFLPDPLPPVPPLEIRGRLLRELEDAVIALGRLDGVSALLQDRHLFLYAYLRKEAVLSSQIEGTQSTLSDLLAFETEGALVIPPDDVEEVSCYVAALQHGMRLLRGNLPVSSRLLREVHGKLLAHGRGSSQMPGEFRTSQNWVGGSRPGNARFVPPPAYAVADCISALEQFIHAQPPQLPALIRVGLAHVQFETIHPFLDGNGRVGRLLIILQLCDLGVLREPLLYLSLYLKQNRDAYYDLLSRVRHGGEWEEWLLFFLKGIRITAEDAVATVHRLQKMFAADRETLARQGRRAGSALRAYDAMKARPVLSLPDICKYTSLSFPTASSAMQLLIELNIAREVTGKSRDRLFVYGEYLDVLNEDGGTP